MKVTPKNAARSPCHGPAARAEAGKARARRKAARRRMGRAWPLGRAGNYDQSPRGACSRGLIIVLCRLCRGRGIDRPAPRSANAGKRAGVRAGRIDAMPDRRADAAGMSVALALLALPGARRSGRGGGDRGRGGAAGGARRARCRSRASTCRPRTWASPARGWRPRTTRPPAASWARSSRWPRSRPRPRRRSAALEELVAEGVRFVVTMADARHDAGARRRGGGPGADPERARARRPAARRATAGRTCCTSPRAARCWPTRWRSS